MLLAVHNERLSQGLSIREIRYRRPAADREVSLQIQFQLDLEFDGRPLDPDDLRLGRSEVAPEVQLPFVAGRLDPRHGRGAH